MKIDLKRWSKFSDYNHFLKALDILGSQWAYQKH